MGRSGSGKSTLLSLLAGFDLPDEGSVRFNGEKISGIDLDRYRRDEVAMIFQSYNLLPFLTVLENVMYPLSLKMISTEKAAFIAQDMLLTVELQENFFNRMPHMLSGGEQQRVAIARALASDAKVILADEPTGNLDSENAKNIIKILKKLAHDKGKCVIVVTHDPNIADEADEILQMIDGRLIGNVI
jgi:putative ABC transport system ATP-binding protein